MKMKAIVCTKYGSLDVLQLKEVEKLERGISFTYLPLPL
jgi:hypothetical protein